MRYNGSNRVGWNSRGGTDREQLQAILETNEVYRLKAIGLLQQLLDFLGNQDYQLWLELTWPSDGVDQASWRDIATKAKEAWEMRRYLYQMFECTCEVGDACPACAARNRLQIKELPYNKDSIENAGRLFSEAPDERHPHG